MIDVNEISRSIKLYRQNAGLTQAELAEKMFIVPQTVSKWERGLSVPTVTELSMLSDILCVPIGAFLKERQADEQSVMIAVDGGGTKTEFLAFSEDGFIKRAVLGGSNPNVVGIETTERILKEGIDSLVSGQKRIRAIYCGIAGAANKKHADHVTSFLKDRFYSALVLVESDVKNVVGLLSDPDNCVAVIMGTGSSVFSFTNGKMRRYGGWGYVFDGAGSGYDIGRECIKRTLAYEDGIGNFSEVVRLCLDKTGGNLFSKISSFHERGVDYVASFASIAFEAARKGDVDGQCIVKQSTDRIVWLIKSALLEQNDKTKVVLSGGLCAHADVILPLLTEDLYGVEIIVPTDPQIFGAVNNCLALSGVKLDEENYEKIRKFYAEETK